VRGPARNVFSFVRPRIKYSKRDKSSQVVRIGSGIGIEYIWKLALFEYFSHVLEGKERLVSSWRNQTGR